MTDNHIRWMTPEEEVAYAWGHQDAQDGKRMTPYAHGRGFNERERLTYERGYRNYAGEAVDG